MKTLKQLLWFIVPTLTNASLLFVFILSNTSNTPQFIGGQKYFILFIKDPTFLRAMLNTLLYAFIAGGAIFAIKLFLLKDKLNVLYYAFLFVIPTTIFYFTSNLSKAIGLPLSAYSCHTLVSYDKSFDYINIPSILISIQVGILMSFLFWTVEKIIYKIRRKNDA